jgi:CBS domain-containing protein
MTHTTSPAIAPLVLAARTAQDLMSTNPVSVEGDASVQDAIALMTDRGYSAVPVIDEAGRPIGVLSRTDILVHEREQVRHAQPAGEVESGGRSHKPRHEGFSIEVVDPTPVRDIMTPAIFTVEMHTAAAEVVRRILELRVHQMFVVDKQESLIGVISALDVLRHLQPQR